MEPLVDLARLQREEEAARLGDAVALAKVLARELGAELRRQLVDLQLVRDPRA